MTRPETEIDVYSINLTKREMFAAMAMQGMLSTEQYDPNHPGNIELSVVNAVKIADALITELNKTDQSK